MTARTPAEIAAEGKPHAADAPRHGPIGFSFMESAPRDGTRVRLRNRWRHFMFDDDEHIGRFHAVPQMKAGGVWLDDAGNYLTPYYWAPLASAPKAGEADAPPEGKR